MFQYIQTRQRMIQVGILAMTLILCTCWVSPNDLIDQTATPDDSSVSQNKALRETGAFNDFIDAVYQASTEDKQGLVDVFMSWVDSSTGVPYIEESTAYFLYRNTANVNVHIAGDFCNWSPEGQSFSRLLGTDLYYKSYTFENDARLDYKLVVNGNWILDPLNPRTCSGGYGPNSELSMSGYIHPPEIQIYTIPHGTVSATTFSDTTQGRTRSIKIYTPPGYADTQFAYGTMYFLDGSEYVSLGYAPQVLDYLIAEHLIPPMIAVFTDPTNRMTEYAYDYDFMAMFVNELVPWIDAQYRTQAGPESRAIAGVSLGGLTSLLFTIQHPEIFGNCGAYSPAVQFGDIHAQYSDSAVLPVKIYMDAGSYEPTIYNAASELLQILDGAAWDHSWKSWHEGHSWGSWRAHLDESLLYFWPLSSTGIDERF